MGRSLPLLEDAPRAAALSTRAPAALRISVLDACNLRCGYCAPGALHAPMHASRWLTVAEHSRLAPHFARIGIRKLRFTGGEPLLRPDLENIVSAWRSALPHAEMALTTNGTHLAARAQGLHAAGVQRVTVHLDTLRPSRYGALMGSGSPAQVLDAVEVAQQVFDAVKLNVVVQRHRNDDELREFLALSVRMGVEVRFIEIMSTGSANDVAAGAFVAGAEIVQRLEARALPRRDAADPASLFATPDGVQFGVIASETAPFCSACDRLRLTANGRLRACLYQSGGVPLGAQLRDGATDDVIAQLVASAVAAKRSYHPSLGASAPFSMADVGG